MQNIPVVNHAGLRAQLALALKQRRPLLIHGQPGVGKTEAVGQVAQAINALLVTVILSQKDTTDLTGLPDLSGEVTTFKPPLDIPFEGSPGWPTDRPIIVFLDELLQASPAMQAIAMQLTHERRIGANKLRDNVLIVAATNDAKHKAGAHKMLTPLANRFRHVELQTNADEWCALYAEPRGLPLTVRTFLKEVRPQFLNTFEEACTKGLDAYATPRSWAAVAELVSMDNLSRETRDQAIEAEIGCGIAAEYLAFEDVFGQLPKLSEILESPDTAPVPSQPDRRAMVTYALYDAITPTNAGNVLTYMRRLPPEYRQALLQMVNGSATKAVEMIMVKPWTDFTREMDKIVHG